jgi:DNA-directed RNA polymerase subunit RPC12/RpoP
MTLLKTYSTEGPRCPYCSSQFTADEGCYYDESNYTEQECDECGKTFNVSVYTQTSWICTPVDVP